MKQRGTPLFARRHNTKYSHVLIPSFELLLKYQSTPRDIPLPLSPILLLTVPCTPLRSQCSSQVCPRPLCLILAGSLFVNSRFSNTVRNTINGTRTLLAAARMYIPEKAYRIFFSTIRCGSIRSIDPSPPTDREGTHGTIAVARKATPR